MTKQPNLTQIAKAKIEILRRQSWDDFYIFAKYVCGNDLMEEQPHRELCEALTVGLDKSEHLDLNFSPPISNEYVSENLGKLKKLIMLPRGAFKCLKIDTNILMADGSVKKIQDIKVGDSVLGINNDTLQPEVAEVTHHAHMGSKDVYKVTTDNGQYKIESSENHRFYTPTGEYKELSELQVGDPVGIMDNNYKSCKEHTIKWVKIKSIEYIGEYPTYDFETTTHNYVAEGFVVHNSTVATQALTLWLLWHNPNLRIMIDTEVKSNSKKYLAGIKDMIRNNTMLRLICTDEEGNYLLEPNMDIAGGWTDEQIILKNRTKIGLKEPSIICAGADIAVTGMHPDVIIMDDLVSERNVGTKDQIEKVKDHYRMSLSLLEPGGAQIVIGTRYHMNDLYADLLEFDTFDKLVRPAVFDDGSLYFPSRLTKEFLEEKRKEQGTYIFNSQYMLNPIDDSNAVFKKAWIQYFDKLPHFVEVHILTDLAISQRETADYTVVMAVGITSDKKIYVIEYARGRFTPNETIDELFDMYLKYKTLYNIKTVGVEGVAFQKAMIYFIKDEMRRRGVYMPLKELKADRDKNRRIGALQPLFENGDVYIRQEHTDLEQELLEFPVSKHDDISDCLAYILQVIRAVSYDYKPSEYKYKPLNSVTGY